MEIPSHLTLDEVLHLCDLPARLVELITELQEVATEADEELEAQRVYLERVEEQVHFARDLVEEVDAAVSRFSRMREFKNLYQMLRENTYFEL